MSHSCVPGVRAQSLKLCCDPLDYGPPGSSVHGIFQARILELVAISYSGTEPSSLASPTLTIWEAPDGSFSSL